MITSVWRREAAVANIGNKVYNDSPTYKTLKIMPVLCLLFNPVRILSYANSMNLESIVLISLPEITSTIDQQNAFHFPFYLWDLFA